MSENSIDKGLRDIMAEDGRGAAAGGGNAAADIFGGALDRMADMTLGYAVSTAAGLLVLTFILPNFYVHFAAMAKATGRLPGIGEVFDGIYGGGGTVFLAMVGGFFAGGWALSRSYEWGRFLLKYLFTLWGLIILFEMRYWGFVKPDRQGMLNLAVTALFIFVVAMAVYGFRRRNLASIRILSGFCLLFSLVNICMAVSMFARFDVFCPDRHVHYLSLVFIAALLMQAAEALATFVPAVWNARK